MAPTPRHWLRFNSTSLVVECEAGGITIVPAANRSAICMGCGTAIDFNTHVNPTWPQPSAANSKRAVAPQVTEARCAVCGELMPEGQEMFNYHGFNGKCPKPPLKSKDDPGPACECGSEAIGGGVHSTWCPKYA